MVIPDPSLVLIKVACRDKDELDFVDEYAVKANEVNDFTLLAERDEVLELRGILELILATDEERLVVCGSDSAEDMQREAVLLCTFTPY